MIENDLGGAKSVRQKFKAFVNDIKTSNENLEQSDELKQSKNMDILIEDVESSEEDSEEDQDELIMEDDKDYEDTEKIKEKKYRSKIDREGQNGVIETIDLGSNYCKDNKLNTIEIEINKIPMI